MTAGERSGADILVACLEAAGITTLFGVPGDTGVGLYDALARSPGRVRHVLANDERGAAFMADVYARRTNRVGALEVSSGGGVTFAVGGLGEPFAASVPLLVITSDISRRSRGTGALTEIDQPQLLRAVTKWQGVADGAAELPELFSETLEAAVSGRPAPVALIVPEDVLDERARVEIAVAQPSLPPRRPGAPAEAVGAVARSLEGARRPAIVAGGGVHLSGAQAELQGLAESLGVPVATTVHGKGAISDASPWSLGTAGANGGLDAVNEYLAGADWVLFVGTRANATDTNSFTAPPRSCPAVSQIDVDPSRAGRNYPGSTPLVGDARTVLAQLREAARAEPAAEVRAAVARCREAAARQVLPAGGRDGLDPAAVFRTLNQVAGGGVTVVGDCGTPTPHLASSWELEEAGRSLLLARGHGPMGYALPGAVGAALAAPGEAVLAIVTDGSLLMAAGALECAAREGLPIVYVHLSNGTLGWIKTLQHLYLERRYFSTDLSRFDAVGVAAALGVESYRITSLDELATRVREGLDGGRPRFLDVPIPSEEEALPPVAPWRKAAEGTKERPVY